MDKRHGGCEALARRRQIGKNVKNNEASNLYPACTRQVRRKRVSKRLVIEITIDPDDVDLESERRKIAQKLKKGKLLRIVYDEEGELIVVISPTAPRNFVTA
jgi:hypothetical protein